MTIAALGKRIRERRKAFSEDVLLSVTRLEEFFFFFSRKSPGASGGDRCFPRSQCRISGEINVFEIFMDRVHEYLLCDIAIVTHLYK